MPLGKRVAESPTRASRIKGGIYGLLIGDALGVPYEFHPARAIPPANRIEMEPPAGFPRAHAGTPPGTWSTDCSKNRSEFNQGWENAQIA